MSLHAVGLVGAAAPVRSSAGAAGERAAPSAIERRLADRIAPFEGQLGLYTKDLDTGEVIAVGADDRYPTASLIKVAVMAEVYRQIATGRLSAAPRSRSPTPTTPGTRTDRSSCCMPAPCSRWAIFST
jgi:beta-lactamase class A